MSDFDAAAVEQYRLHASFEAGLGRKVFVAAIEGGGRCGTIQMFAHATLEGATQSLREMVQSELGYDEEDLARLNADEIQGLVEDEHGKAARVGSLKVFA